MSTHAAPTNHIIVLAVPKAVGKQYSKLRNHRFPERLVHEKSDFNGYVALFTALFTGVPLSGF